MNFKLVVFGACLALVASASIPSDPSQVDLREAFETEDAYYIPISEEEAERNLRQPKYFAESVMESFPVEEMIEEPSVPNSSHNRREQRSVDAFETEDAYYIPLTDNQAESSRAKRQLRVQGGGSLRQGFDIYAQGRAKLWESNNKRNSVHGTAEYSQHLGGPYGNSRPNYGGGLTFTHRF